jgi:N-methylhydantoinase B/oxoprolinase/acetone carboxylase alpha subunit
MKLFDRGEPNQVLMQIVRVNVRQPDEVIGDFYAQTASNDAGGRSHLAQRLARAKPVLHAYFVSSRQYGCAAIQRWAQRSGISERRGGCPR